MAKRRQQKLTLEAFLEAIEDASGFEDDVLRHLALKPRELRDWLAKYPDAKRAALERLEEREVDTGSYRIGWLRGDLTLAAASEAEDPNWARLRELLQEEVVLAGQDVLEGAKNRTAELVEKLRLQKQAARVPKQRLERDWDE
jgi:hypothetical protein